MSDIYDQRKYIATANSNIAHTCGNVCAIITEHFKSKFPDNFFKHDHITTEIAIKQFKKIKTDLLETKWSKPYLIVQPKIVMGDPTEAHVDVWRRLYGTSIYDVTRSSGETNKFFYDESKGIIIDFGVERAKMSFQFSVILSTEYQQYNVSAHMSSKLRVEHPYYLPTRLETIIPDYILQNLSNDSGIPILDSNNKPYKFLKYVNSISKIPVTLEYQPATGQYRFRLVVQTSIIIRFTNLDISDGDQDNMITDSFPITVNADMEFNYPSCFFYVTDTEKPPTFELDNTGDRDDIGLGDLSMGQATFFHTIQKIIIPEEDVHHKKLYDMVAFITDNEEIDTINFSEIIDEEYIDIIKELKNKELPISSFININIYENEHPKHINDYDLDYDNFKLVIRNTKTYHTYRIALYIDNNTLYEYKLRNYKYQ